MNKKYSLYFTQTVCFHMVFNG